MSKEISNVTSAEANDVKPARAQLEEVDHDGRPSFVLTYTEVKLLGIAGVRYTSIRFSLLLIVG